MQTPVRFYITQNEDRPVVRTIPISPRAAEDDLSATASDEKLVTETMSSPPKRVTNLVRAAVKRSSGTSK